MFLIMLIGIIGNTSIIIIILWNKLLRLQPTNLFLLNMAVSDFLNLCICPILYLFRRDVLFIDYYLGKICCLITPGVTGKFINALCCKVVVYLFMNIFFISHNICIWSIEPKCHNFEQGLWYSDAKISKFHGIQSLSCLYYSGCYLVDFHWSICTSIVFQRVPCKHE